MSMDNFRKFRYSKKKKKLSLELTLESAVCVFFFPNLLLRAFCIFFPLFLCLFSLHPDSLFHAAANSCKSPPPPASWVPWSVCYCKDLSQTFNLATVQSTIQIHKAVGNKWASYRINSQLSLKWLRLGNYICGLLILLFAYILITVVAICGCNL